MTYMDMLMEYKRSESALRERIGQINAAMRDRPDSAELEELHRRKILLEQELYELLDVISEIYGYAGCGVDTKCKNA